MQDEDPSLLHEKLIEKMFIGMSENVFKNMDPENTAAEVLDIKKSLKQLEPHIKVQEWMKLKKFNLLN